MKIVNPKQSATYDLSGSATITFGPATFIIIVFYGPYPGVYGSANVDWSVTNLGSISAGTALYFKGDATVVNDATGKLSSSPSGFSVIRIDGVGNVTNAGLIQGRGAIGTEYEIAATAINLAGGGTVINDASGKIYGSVKLKKTGKVTNSGLIMPEGRYSIGIDLRNGGKVVNNGSVGMNYGYVTGMSLGNGATAINAGKITGSSSHCLGIYLPFDGKIFNNGIIEFKSSDYVTGIEVLHRGSLNNTGEISVTASTGHAYGVELLARGSIINSGAIEIEAPLHGEGVLLKKGGTVDNLVGGSISGGTLTGIYADGSKGVAITNAGEISGANASLIFANVAQSSTGITNLLTLQTGSDLVGEAVGSTGAFVTNDLVFEGHGTASNVFADFQALTVETAASWVLSAAAEIAETDVEGVLEVSQTGSLSGALTIEGGSAIFEAKYEGNVTFDGAGTLELSDPYTGIVSGLVAKDEIGFLDLAYETGDQVSVIGEVLTVENASNQSLATLTLGNPNYSSSNFTVGKDMSGHVLLSYA